MRRLTSVMFVVATLCASAATAQQSSMFINPFKQDSAGTPPISEERTQTNPFGDTPTNSSTVAPRCSSATSLGRAELRKSDMALALCESRYTDLDDEWVFILSYVSGFNEFLEERGSFMDPTGACARVAEPRHRLGLTYEITDYATDYLLGRLAPSERIERLDEMLKPFREDWKRIPFILRELNIWSREGRLDATSIATRGMCSDPEFQFFWSRALEYAQRVPGTDQ
ncbi:hypothetical protein [Fluviibacterium sp. S390]|uniref:hypothetical protein n=1 Tax=Fluviibacterium sp. S390 TaxID=3415139 RepID=UPI003C79EDCE